MKKLSTFVLAFFLFGFSSLNVSANQTEFHVDDQTLENIIEESGMSEKEVVDMLESEWEYYLEVYNSWGEEDNALNSMDVENFPKLKEIESQTNEAGISNTSRLGTYGDVLVTLDSIVSGYGGHAAIVSTYSNDWTLEAFAYGWSKQHPKVDGVYWHINDWKNRGYKKVAGYYVNEAPLGSYRSAGTYAENQVLKPYNFDFKNKFTTSKFYCSQLVWRAWYNQGYNLDSNGGDTVMPADISKSNHLRSFYKVGM